MGGSQSSSTDQAGTNRAMQYGGQSEVVTGIQPFQQQFATDYSGLMNQYKQRINQPMNIQSAPLYSKALDPIIQAQISKGMGAINAQNNTANRQMATSLNRPGTGNNTALLAALQRQGSIQSAGATNALYPAALEAQRGYDLQRQQMLQGVNATNLAARQQSIGELGQGGNLMQLLNQMAGTSAGRVTMQAKKENQEQTGQANTESSKSFF